VLNNSTPPPVGSLEEALGALNTVAVVTVARFGAAKGWSCAQLVAALEVVGDDDTP